MLGQCVGCTGDCSGRGCGDDGCGGSCGTCTTGLSCEDGQCYAYATCAEAFQCAALCIAGGGLVEDCLTQCTTGMETGVIF